MSEDTFLAAIGLGVENRLSKDYGFFDTISLTASYSFSYEEYLRDKKRTSPDLPLSELLKTILHETTHLYQMLATPYGLYYFTLRSLQTDIVRRLTRLLPQKYGVAPHPPLTRSSTRTKTIDNRELKHLLHGWALAELISLYLEGDIDAFAQLLGNSLLGQVSLTEQFQRLESFVTAFLNANGKRCPSAESRLEDSESNRISELQYFGLKAVYWPDTRGIIESWAKVAEYWGARKEPLVRYPELFPKVIDADMIDYHALLVSAREAIDAQTVGEFILSYMALCEVALSPPLLPYYQALRWKQMTLRELNPTHRIMDLVTAAKGISPIRDLERDYVRFTTEVCAKLNWPTPVDMAKETLRIFRIPAGDKLFEFYVKAQEFRVRVPHIFLDLGVWFLPERTYTREFQNYFTHPVIEFEDGVGHHPDPNVFVFFTELALINSYTRKLLLAKDTTVTLPYKAPQVEVEYFSRLLESDLEILLGIKSIRVNLVSPR